MDPQQWSLKEFTDLYAFIAKITIIAFILIFILGFLINLLFQSGFLLREVVRNGYFDGTDNDGDHGVISGRISVEVIGQVDWWVLGQYFFYFKKKKKKKQLKI